MPRIASKNRADAARRLDHLQRACRERSLRLTPQRKAVLETLVASGDHPSAEQVHARVSRTLRGMSRGTVFRILDQLVASGVIAKACHPGRSARYDVRTELHHHLVCLRCESMTDFFDDALDGVPMPDTTIHNFDIVDYRVQLRGYCTTCRREMKKEGKRP